MWDTIIDVLYSHAKHNKDIILITGDLGFGVLDKFSKDFPAQFINAGVSEQNMTGMAAGLALEGKKVFTYSIGNFNTLRCLEQIRNDICYHELDVTIISVGGGFSYGQLGMSHFATEDIAILNSLPNMKVVAPSSKKSASIIMKQIINDKGPYYLRVDKSTADEFTKNISKYEIGKINISNVKSDILIFGYGGILKEAYKAQKILKEKKIFVKVIDLHTIKPVDKSGILKLLNENSIIITLEEHNYYGGIGQIISEICVQNSIVPKKFYNFCLKDIYPKIVGSQDYLKEYFELTATHIVKKIIKLFD